MSVKIMGLVWDADLPRDEKYVAIAYADHAAHDGTSIFPSVGMVSWKTGYSERSVQSITKKLIKKGILIPCGQHPRYGTNMYRIDINRLPERTPYRGVQNLQGGAEFAGGGVQNATKGGANSAPKPSLNHQVNHQNKYIEPDPDKIVEIKTAVAGISKTPLWFETEEQYTNAAYALAGWEASIEQIEKFPEWWRSNGHYSGKPALKSILGEWRNYTNGNTLSKGKRASWTPA